jgi:Ni,Fe-hydrogenase III small subunit
VPGCPPAPIEILRGILTAVRRCPRDALVDAKAQ